MARDPPGDILFIGMAASVLTVILFVNVLNVLHEHAESGHPLRFWEPIVWEGSSGIIFLTMSPAILFMARRFWLLTPPRLPKLAAHALAAAVVSLVHVLFVGYARWAVYRALASYYDPYWPLNDWAYEFRKDLLVYSGVVAVYHLWRQIRARPSAASGPKGEVLEVRDGARRHFVPLSEVIWVEAAGNYVELHLGASRLLHRASLSQMEQRLENTGFVRIHRSRLVRREAIAAVESKPTGDFVARLRDGRELAGSRRYRRPLLAGQSSFGSGGPT
jgi:hypothetical protein